MMHKRRASTNKLIINAVLLRFVESKNTIRNSVKKYRYEYLWKGFKCGQDVRININLVYIIEIVSN